MGTLPPTGARTCKHCLVEQTNEDFYPHPAAKDGLTWKCKTCVSTYNKKRTPPGGYKNNPEVQRNAMLQRTYGITSQDYEWLHNLQGGLCAICRRPERDGTRLAVDHCHTSGKVRGLLCMACNTALGKFQDSEEILQAAVRYLNLSP